MVSNFKRFNWRGTKLKLPSSMTCTNVTFVIVQEGEYTKSSSLPIQMSTDLALVNVLVESPRRRQFHVFTWWQ